MLFIEQVTLTLAAAILILCVALSVIFAAPGVSSVAYLTSIFTWALTFGLVLLVPMDISLAWYLPDTPELRDFLSKTYLTLYWSVYLLTWTVVPLVQEFEEAGDLNGWDRLARSLRANGVFYLYLFGAAAVFSLLMWWLQPGLFSSMDSLKALGHCYGSLLLVILFSYSLYFLPIGLWQESTPEGIFSIKEKAIQKAKR